MAWLGAETTGAATIAEGASRVIGVLGGLGAMVVVDVPDVDGVDRVDGADGADGADGVVEVGSEVDVELVVGRAVTWGWWLVVAPIAGKVVDVVGRVDVVRPVDVVGLIGPVDVVGAVDVVGPVGPVGGPVGNVGTVGTVDEPVVEPVAEVVEVVPAVVVGTLEELGVATGTVPGATSGWVVLVVLGSVVAGGTVVEGSVVTDEALVNPVVVVDGAVVVVVGGTDVTEVTDVTDGSDVALPGGKVVVVVGVVPAAADRAGMPIIPPTMTKANTVPRDPAARRASRLVEIGEEKGISGHPRSLGRPAQPAG